MNAELDPLEAVAYLLEHVSAMLNQDADQVLQEQLGIGLAQFKILRLLQRHDELQQRQLAAHLGQTEASVSRQVKLLRQKGLLAQRIDPQNKRVHLTALTAKGAKLADAAHDTLLHYLRPLLAALPEKPQKQLLESLKLLHDSVCRAGAAAVCDRPFGV